MPLDALELNMERVEVRFSSVRFHRPAKAAEGDRKGNAAEGAVRQTALVVRVNNAATVIILV